MTKSTRNSRHTSVVEKHDDVPISVRHSRQNSRTSVGSGRPSPPDATLNGSSKSAKRVSVAVPSLSVAAESPPPHPALAAPSLQEFSPVGDDLPSPTYAAFASTADDEPLAFSGPEKRWLRTLYEQYRRSRPEKPNSVVKIVRHIDHGASDDQLVEYLSECGHRPAHVLTYDQLEQFALSAKARRGNVTEDQQESIDSFVRLGGNADCSGDIDANALRGVIIDFGLRIDIDALIREVDEDNSGKIDFEEFSQFYRGLRSKTRRRDILDFDRLGESSAIFRPEVSTRKRSIGTVRQADKPIQFLQGTQRLVCMLGEVNKGHTSRVEENTSRANSIYELPPSLSSPRAVRETNQYSEQKRIDNELSPLMERIRKGNKEDRLVGRRSTTRNLQAQLANQHRDEDREHRQRQHKERIEQLTPRPPVSRRLPLSPAKTRPSTAPQNGCKNPQSTSSDGELTKLSLLQEEERKLNNEMHDRQQQLEMQLLQLENETQALRELQARQREVQSEIHEERLSEQWRGVPRQKTSLKTHRNTRDGDKYSILSKPKKKPLMPQKVDAKTPTPTPPTPSKRSPAPSAPVSVKAVSPTPDDPSASDDDDNETIATFTTATTEATSQARTEQDGHESHSEGDAYSDDDFEIDPADLEDSDASASNTSSSSVQPTPTPRSTPEDPHQAPDASATNIYDPSQVPPPPEENCSSDVTNASSPIEETKHDHSSSPPPDDLSNPSPAVTSTPAPSPTKRKKAPHKVNRTPYYEPTPEKIMRAAFFKDGSKYTEPFRAERAAQNMADPAKQITPRMLAKKLEGISSYTTATESASATRQKAAENEGLPEVHEADKAMGSDQLDKWLQ